MSADRFRRAALALPGAVEGSHGGHPDFRVGQRIFASLFYPDKDWGMVKLTPEQQAMVVDAELAKADLATLRSALTMAWQNVAPKPRAKKKKS